MILRYKIKSCEYYTDVDIWEKTYYYHQYAESGIFEVMNGKIDFAAWPGFSLPVFCGNKKNFITLNKNERDIFEGTQYYLYFRLQNNDADVIMQITLFYDDATTYSFEKSCGAFGQNDLLCVPCAPDQLLLYNQDPTKTIYAYTITLKNLTETITFNLKPKPYNLWQFIVTGKQIGRAHV